MICGFAAGNIAQGGDQPAFADQHAQVEPCGGPLGRAVVQGDGITQCRETPATERKAEAGARRVRPMRLVVAAVMEPATEPAWGVARVPSPDPRAAEAGADRTAATAPRAANNPKPD